MPGLSKSRITHNFFLNTNTQIGKKNRVHFKPFAFSKQPIRYRKTPFPVKRLSRKNNKKKRKTLKKQV